MASAREGHGRSGCDDCRAERGSREGGALEVVGTGKGDGRCGVKIHDLEAETAYVATTRDECRGIDAHAFDMACDRGEVVTMGRVIAEPVDMFFVVQHKRGSFWIVNTSHKTVDIAKAEAMRKSSTHRMALAFAMSAVLWDVLTIQNTPRLCCTTKNISTGYAKTRPIETNSPRGQGQTKAWETRTGHTAGDEEE